MGKALASFALGLGLGLGILVGFATLGPPWGVSGRLGAPISASIAPKAVVPATGQLAPASAAKSGGTTQSSPLTLAQDSGAGANLKREVPENADQMQLSFAPIVSKVSAAVVNVYATTVSQQYVSPFANDPFFGRFFGMGSPLMRQQPRTQQSLGSGVIVDPSGLIVTNSHVVNGATTIRATISDGHEYDVEVVLNDTKSDLAVLRIKNPNGRVFPALQFANSDALQVGDLVLAIGNPFGVGQTVTSGIVSALARTGVESTDYSFFIQTDAAINPGNSGGALVDMNGKLVGINSAIYTRGGGSVGIGFAIPANMVQLVANAGRNGTAIVRPWFGARFQDLTTDLATSLGLDVPRGALIAEVAPDSAAARAGLKPSDVIVKIDGQEVDDAKAFGFRLATKPIGSTVQLDVVRNGRVMSVVAAVEAPPPTSANDRMQIGGQSIFSGVTAQTLTPPIAQEYGLSYSMKGVVLSEVAKGSTADQVGFQKGDIIFQLNGEQVDDARKLQSLANTNARGWRITMQRNGRRFQTVVGG